MVSVSGVKSPSMVSEVGPSSREQPHVVVDSGRSWVLEVGPVSTPALKRKEIAGLELGDDGKMDGWSRDSQYLRRYT